MKKLLVAVAVMVAAITAQAQGTISFNNFTGPTVTTVGGVALNNAFTAELLAGTSAASLVSIATTKYGSPAASFFNAGADIAIAGIAAGQQAVIQLRVFDGASFAAATTQRGQSGTATVTLGGSSGGGPPATSPGIAGVGAFSLTLIPEPSTLALGLLAGAGLLALRRRK